MLFYEPKIVILNTSILTNYGKFNYYSVSLEIVKESVLNREILSAVGHESTAQIISSLLNIQCPVNRIQYIQHPRDCVFIFKLNGRPPEGKILSIKEIEEIGFTWGRLSMEGRRINCDRIVLKGNDVNFAEICEGEKDGVYFSLNSGPYIGPYSSQTEAKINAEAEIMEQYHKPFKFLE
jgi:hypothetical protein